MALNINGTTGISGVDASVSAPALTGTDSNTGISFPSADTIKFSTGGVERMSITNSGVSGITAGITMADQWRITSVTSLSSGSGDLTSNWERNDHASFSGIGSAMTESSGLFSFPVTGIYLIMVDIVFVSSGAQYQGFSVRATQDNGSNFSNIAQSYGGSRSNSGSEYDSVCAQVIFDVTNTSNDKFKLQYEVNTSVSIDGNSNTQRSGLTVIRLGDT